MSENNRTYSILNEPLLVTKMNEEIQHLINYYHNVKRPSVFLRYYNINVPLSPTDSLTKATYDMYTKANTKFDLYELTPAYMVGAIQNSINDLQELKGNMIDSNTTLTLYTISTPRIGDLVTFYEPIHSKEVFKVANVRMQLNSRYSSEELHWFDVDLETAPVKYDHLDNLLINDHMVYDLSVEKYRTYPVYKSRMQLLDNTKKLLNQLVPMYEPLSDLYFYEEPYISPELNQFIYLLRKKFTTRWERLFESIPMPFGYWSKYPIVYSDINQIDLSKEEYEVINFTTKELLTVSLKDSSELNAAISICKELRGLINELDK